MGPTTQEVIRLWQHFQDVFETRIENKAESIMVIGAEILSGLEIQDKKTFLENYTTTIGKTIYTPFTVGTPHPRWSLWEQMMVCVHEHQHVYQYKAFKEDFFARYIFSTACRSRFEVQAYISNAAMTYWRTGRVIVAAELAGRLRAYGCSPDDIMVATRAIVSAEETIKQGGIINIPLKVFWDWAIIHAPRLLACA